MMKKIFYILLIAFFPVVIPNLSFAHDPILSDLKTKAEQGDTKEQIHLGIIYAGCYGVPCNADEALKWFHKAADRGNAEAQYDIGNLYASSELLLYPDSHVQQDNAEAMKWWKKAAEQGYIPAQNKLGQVYENGLAFADFTGKYRRLLGVVRVDYTEAMKWYRKAADQGHAPSQAPIGDLYAKGRGVPQDLVQAYVWYSRSGSVSAAHAHDLEKKMTPAQIAEAGRLTQGWKPPPFVLTQKPAVPAGLLANPFIKQAIPRPPIVPAAIPTTWQMAVSRAGVGDVMPDGSIYLGKFHSVRWFVMDSDAKDSHGKSRLMNFDQAQKYAKGLKAHGHADWVIPDQDILEQMFGNKHKGIFKGSYDESGNFNSGWYWSSTSNPKWPDDMLGQWFSSGNSGWIPKANTFSVRCVRSMAQ